MPDPRVRSTTDAISHHGRILGSVDVEAPDGRTVEARLRLVEGGAASDDELAAIHHLLQRTFRRWPDFEVGGSSLDHLRWKIEGPASTRSYALIWEVEGAVVGANLAVYRDLRVRGVEQIGLNGADSATDPAWQGRGLRTHRRRLRAASGVEPPALALGTTNHRRGVYHRPGNWALHTPIRVLLSVNNPWRVAAAWRERGGRRLPRPAVATALWGMRAVATLRSLSARRRLRPPANVRPVRLRAAERFDARVDALFEAAARDFDLLVVRGHDYLNWRFCDERGGRYAVLLAEAEESDELLGYIVTRRDGDRGYVVDLLARPGRLDVVDSLLHRALRDLRSNGTAGVLCWMVEDHPYMPALRHHGFFNSRRDPRLGFRAAAGMPAAEHAFLREPGARVHLTHGDTDVI